MVETLWERKESPGRSTLSGPVVPTTTKDVTGVQSGASTTGPGISRTGAVTCDEGEVPCDCTDDSSTYQHTGGTVASPGTGSVDVDGRSSSTSSVSVSSGPSSSPYPLCESFRGTKGTKKR